MKKLAIFASGSGSNAQKIYNFFQKKPDVIIECVVVSSPSAGIIDKAKDWGCNIIQIERDGFYSSDNLTKKLKKTNIDLVILAGFLWLIPNHLLKGFPNKILNIHPSLLPKYGGKGMYGMNVHKAVFEAKESESGITIHTIDEEYDRGQILFQESVNIKECSSPKEIASAVLKSEHENFAKVIEEYLSK